MKIVEMLVTPEVAIRWLEGNVKNRDIRDSVVARYARDMKAGNWKLVHQPIAFTGGVNNANGASQLIDGQHRLHAVMESATPVRLMVATDVPLDTQAVIDDALPRTMVDTLRLAYNHTDASNMEVAVAKAFWRARNQSKPSRQELVHLIALHKDAIFTAIGLFPVTRVRGITILPVMTVMARATYGAPPERLKTFAKILVSGQTEHLSEDGAALALRDYLLLRAPKSGAVAFQTIYGKTERALAAFIAEETPVHLYAATTELFPLPEETQPSKRVATTRYAKDMLKKLNTRKKAGAKEAPKHGK